MEKRCLAVDIGSSNGKVILSQLSDDKRIITEEVGRFITPKMYSNGHLSINIYGIYEEICRILTKLGRKNVCIESIGVDTWASDFGLIDTAGNLIGLPVFYRDKRTNGIPEKIEQTISYHDLYYLSTQRRMQDSTLSQMLGALSENAHYFDGTDKMMCIGDLLMYMFGGKVSSEISVASYTQMFSMRKKQWENEIFDLFNIPKHIQPPITNAGDVLGQIGKTQADFIGINQFSVITPAVHDTASAITAVPVKDEKNWACIATGSWYLVSMEMEHPADLEMSYKYNLSNTGLSFGNTLVKKNVCAMWLIQECKRNWEKMGIVLDYSTIAEKAQKAEPFYAFIDTDDTSFYNPDNMIDSVITYLETTGQKAVKKDDIGQISRIIYESIAYKCRYSLQCLKKATRKKVDTLFVIGGTSGVDFLNDLLASACNSEIIAGAQEATAIGNSLLQMYGFGAVSGLDELRGIVRNTYPTKKYYPRNDEAWNRHYNEFLQICRLEACND